MERDSDSWEYGSWTLLSYLNIFCRQSFNIFLPFSGVRDILKFCLDKVNSLPGRIDLSVSPQLTAIWNLLTLSLIHI